METTTISQQNSAGWNFFVRASFGLAVSAMALGIFFMPATLWVKGYLAMGSVYLMASSFIVAKTVRDEFENKKLSAKEQIARLKRKMLEAAKELDFEEAALYRDRIQELEKAVRGRKR